MRKYLSGSLIYEQNHLSENVRQMTRTLLNQFVFFPLYPCETIFSFQNYVADMYVINCKWLLLKLWVFEILLMMSNFGMYHNRINAPMLYA